jgi:hypothetical protein
MFLLKYQFLVPMGGTRETSFPAHPRHSCPAPLNVYEVHYPPPARTTLQKLDKQPSAMATMSAQNDSCSTLSPPASAHTLIMRRVSGHSIKSVTVVSMTLTPGASLASTRRFRTKRPCWICPASPSRAAYPYTERHRCCQDRRRDGASAAQQRCPVEEASLRCGWAW